MTALVIREATGDVIYEGYEMDFVSRVASQGIIPGVIVDNTHVMAPGSPGYLPEDTIVMTPAGQSDGYGWNEFKISVSEHFGTHLDAPSHLGEAGLYSVDQIPAASLIGPAVVIDIRDQVTGNSDYELSVGDIAAWESGNGVIQAGAIVVMLSGWGSRWTSSSAYKNVHDDGFHFPGFSSSAAEWLLENRDISGIGVDTLSIDYGRSEDYPAHRLILGANKWAAENLDNLHQLPPHGALMIVAPIKHAGGSGGPARVLTLFNR